MSFLIVKSIHVLAIISWMAGLLYLPRLFVYHAGTSPGSEASETFKIMERRLMAAIMRPASLVAWMTGLWMAWDTFGFRGGWLHAKLVLVIALSVHHAFQERWLKEFAQDQRRHQPRFFRIQNEVPTLLMIGIVLLVIVKPF
ncbi:MAG: protoporphyrinogen oxidase HemJ [Proteobacteria bacterium]|nr:protoporphyrinogen oxidase HemJ [Pseudomonadota bacterium]